MGNQLTEDTAEQSIVIPLRVGDRVSLFDEVDTDEGGFIAGTMFEDTVEQYVPQTGLLKFENSDIGRAEFNRLVEQAEGIQIV
jgi:hypothetical protein